MTNFRYLEVQGDFDFWIGRWLAVVLLEEAKQGQNLELVILEYENGRS